MVSLDLKTWYLVEGSERKGPYTLREIQALLAEGQITSTTVVVDSIDKTEGTSALELIKSRSDLANTLLDALLAAKDQRVIQARKAHSFSSESQSHSPSPPMSTPPSQIGAQRNMILLLGLPILAALLSWAAWIALNRPSESSSNASGNAAGEVAGEAPGETTSEQGKSSDNVEPVPENRPRSQIQSTFEKSTHPFKRSLPAPPPPPSQPNPVPDPPRREAPLPPEENYHEPNPENIPQPEEFHPRTDPDPGIDSGGGRGPGSVQPDIIPDENPPEPSFPDDSADNSLGNSPGNSNEAGTNEEPPPPDSLPPQ